MSTTFPATRRNFSRRASRLIKHPIQTLRERRNNRQNRKWEIYYAAAIQIGMPERSARSIANEISGKNPMPSPLKKLVQPTLKPYAQRIRRRQDEKERLILSQKRRGNASQ